MNLLLALLLFSVRKLKLTPCQS